MHLAIDGIRTVVYLSTYQRYTSTFGPVMPISLKSPETERLARTLADATGESITEAITRALEERLQRLEAQRTFTQYVAPIQRVQQRIRERPVRDPRTPDDIVGYGNDGAPT